MLCELRTQIAQALGDRCFLRWSRDDDSLWVSDLPRRSGELGATEEHLLAMGVRCSLYEQTRLWSIDLTLERYRALVEAMPSDITPLPRDDRLHAVYSLCRLLLLHPAPLEDQPLWPLRCVLKRMEGSDQAMLDAIPRIHESCAAWLRKGQPLPTAAGRALLQWLLKKEEQA